MKRDNPIEQVTEISVMFYITEEFRSFTDDPICFIRRQISHANHVLSECDIPLKLYIYCIEELEGFKEDPDVSKRLLHFEFAKMNLLNTADMGILMCGTPSTKVKGKSGIRHGNAFMGPPRMYNPFVGPPIAWVYPENSLTFLHEVGHIFGADHDRGTLELQGQSTKSDNSNYGYHIEGSHMCTIMAYRNNNYPKRIPRFSSLDHRYKGLPLGGSKNDNRSQIIQAMVQVSQFGTETGKCGHHNDSCKKKCLSGCCPLYKSEARYKIVEGKHKGTNKIVGDCEDAHEKKWHESNSFAGRLLALLLYNCCLIRI